MTGPRFPLLHGLAPSIAASFSGKNLLFPLAAVAVTALAISSGLDERVRTFTWAHNPFVGTAARFACLYVGATWPLVCGLLLFRTGFHRRDRDLTAAGCAVLQTVLLVAALTLVLKLATGRPQPETAAPATEFHLLAFDPGHGWIMWPSGHTTESAGGAATLMAFYGGRRWFVGLAWAGALAVMGVMLYGCFHWFSDVVAGTLIAYPIGTAVEMRFRLWKELTP